MSRALPQRLLVALLAWPPLGFAAGFMIGELTGCDRAAVTCGDAESLAPWVVQPAIVVLLLLLPRLARAAAVGIDRGRRRIACSSSSSASSLAVAARRTRRGASSSQSSSWPGLSGWSASSAAASPCPAAFRATD